MASLWCKFIRTKENVYVRKEFNSQRIGLEQQHGRCFIVLENQYGRCDVMQNALLFCELICPPCHVIANQEFDNKYMDLELHPETQDVEPS